MDITITVTGQKPISQQLQRMVNALAGKDRALTTAINAAGADSTLKNFAAQGRPTEWVDRYIDFQYAAGRRKAKPWPKLDKTGTMRDTTLESWEAKHTWTRSGNVLLKKIKTVRYGPIHQHGGVNEKGWNIPKRQFVLLSPTEQSDLAKRLRAVGVAILQGGYHG